MSTPSPIGVISFPHVFTARAPSPGADERYSVSLIFDADAQASAEFKAMKKAVMDAAKEKWGDKAEAMIKNGQLRLPFRDATEKSYAGYEDGKVFINAWSRQKPDVIDGRLQDVVPSDLYPGCMGRITYKAFGYDNSGNKGVSIGLNNLQVSDFTTPRLDGKKKGKDEFDQLDMQDQDGAGDGDDLSDDIPFFITTGGGTDWLYD